jgi:DNA-binding YbaB/EbfC family protein
MKNMGNMMKQVQKMQKQMEKKQEELKDVTIKGTAGGGMVTITANGHKQIIDIEIKPEAVDPDDVEMLQDLVLAAMNDVLKQVDELVAKEMGQFTGGMNMPGLF